MGLSTIIRYSGALIGKVPVIDMSGWDYMVIQTSGSINDIRISNDGGAVEGSVSDSALTAPENNAVITNQAIDLSTGLSPAYPITGLIKVPNIGRYVFIEVNSLGVELIIMLKKRK